MATTQKTITAFLYRHIPKDRWVTLSEIYNTFEDDFNEFQEDDYILLISNGELTQQIRWKRNVRNALQTLKTDGAIRWNGNAQFWFPSDPLSLANADNRIDYYIIGSKYGDKADEDVFPTMEEYGVVSTGFASEYELSAFYRKDEDDIITFLKKKKEPSKSYNTLCKFLQLKPGDIIAIKSTGSPKGHRPNLEIVSYAVVVERDGRIYWHDAEKLGHCINVQFISTEEKKEFPLGGYGRTIHHIVKQEVIDLVFNGYKSAETGPTRQKIKSRRRKRSAAESVNTFGQERKGSQGYITKPRHNNIQQMFKQHLEAKYGAKNVLLEENFVDIKLVQSDYIGLYEIKPYDLAEDCIRAGLGQLLSYAFFDRDKRERRLRIVGPCKPDDDEKEFIQFLKKNLSIDFDYEYFEIV